MIFGDKSRASRENVCTWCDDFRLNAPVPCWSTTTECDYLVRVVGHLIGADGRRRIVIRPILAIRVSELEPVAFARAHGNTILGCAGRRYTHRVDCTVSILIHPIVPCGNDDTEISFVPNKGVELSTLIVIRSRLAAAPRIRMNACVLSICIAK